MPLYLLATQLPPQLVLWSSPERCRRRPCVALEQECRQRPKGRLAVLQALPTPCTERTEDRFRVRCHSNQSHLQAVIARQQTRRVKNRTLQRGVSDGTTDDHARQQAQQAGWQCLACWPAHWLPDFCHINLFDILKRFRGCGRVELEQSIHT